MNVYLDNAATTAPCEPAVSAAFYCMIENFGNPSSLHEKGFLAEKAMNNARKYIASALVAAPTNILFTSGATESNNLAIFGSASIYGKRKKKIVTTTIEHPSVSEPIRYLEENGYDVVRIAPNRDGQISHDDIIAAVDDNTCLVSLMLVNNENGYILPVKRAFMGIKRNFPECITHCDAVQGFLKIPIKSNELYADLISISSHKVHGIKGSGVLFFKKGIRLEPQILGGGQENNIRSGTESVPLIAAFGEAVKTLHPNLSLAIKNAEGINTYFRDKLARNHDITINSPNDSCSPFILNLSVSGIKSEVMLHFLEAKGIYVSSGSACSKGKKSAVLSEFGATDMQIDTSIRVSFSRNTTWSDIDVLVNAIEEALQTLAKI